MELANLESHCHEVEALPTRHPLGLRSVGYTFFLCTQRKPSCLVMAAISTAPPTDLGRYTAKRMKPIVVSTRKRARSIASWIGMAGTANVAYRSLAKQPCRSTS